MGAHPGPIARKGGPSRIPARDWKYWLMMALSFFWFVSLAYFLLKSANKHSPNIWWKTQSQLEQTTQGAAPFSITASKPSSSILYPKQGDYYQLNFDVLASFPAGTPDMNNPRMDPGLRAQTLKVDVPESVKILNGQRISVVGFMIPMVLQEDKVQSFILAQSRMTCCYGIVPKLNQWIYVTMEPGKTTTQLMDIPITVYGTLGVGEQFDKKNMGWCLYRMNSDKVDMPQKLWF